MDNTVTQLKIFERVGVFDKEGANRYELKVEIKGHKGKSILVFGMNPATEDIQGTDTTTNYLLNNLLAMEYTNISICNLFSTICTKLKPSENEDCNSNREYIAEVLKRKYDTILIGYGNTFIGNRIVEGQKEWLLEQLKPKEKIVTEITDNEGAYSKLRATSPLYAGQRYSGKWVLRQFVFPEIKKKADVSERTN